MRSNVDVSFIDLLAIEIESDYVRVIKGVTVQLIANASGTGKLNYQWRKKGINKLPDKVIGRNTLKLEIPNIEKSDEGEYYCVVTNMWNRSVESNGVHVTIYGMY